MKKFRTDVLYALIAFEAILIAVVAAVLYPTWVLAVAIASLLFATVETVTNVVRMRKATYDEVEGRYAYKFPVKRFVIYALNLATLTATLVLATCLLFGYALVTFTFFVVGVLTVAIIHKAGRVEFVATLLLAVLVVSIVSYGAAHIVHNNVNLNPGLVSEAETPETETPETETPEVETPEVETPEVETPEVETPEVETPEVETPEVETPEVVTKIYVPETMSYGVPVTVNLEGISVDNLKYGGEDFISIVKVSDNQVVLTLVGIVNDAGEVQIVPTSGYITITDTVSGTNVSIKIVE